MDSLTHIALGACIGEAFFGKTIGKKAMLWGALSQSLPDLDFIASFWMDTTGNLLAHRGFTHSILFCAIVTFAFAFTANSMHRPHNIAMHKWILFFGAEVLLHIFLDGFNNYGVGWFEPFNHYRISFNSIYVADPFFSIWAGIAFTVLLLLKRRNTKRKFWWKFGVVLPGLYLLYCVFNKLIINAAVKEIVQAQNIPHERYFTTPAPLNNWLWYVVTGNDSGYYVGYRSVFDSKKNISFHYFPRNDSLLKSIEGYHGLDKLIRFSQQFYTVEKWKEGVVFNDLRFGQIIGWQDPNEHFVFHYFLQDTIDNTLVVQRGRFAKWNSASAKSMFKRIRGN